MIDFLKRFLETGPRLSNAEEIKEKSQLSCDDHKTISKRFNLSVRLLCMYAPCKLFRIIRDI